jgi:hypothetical protein
MATIDVEAVPSSYDEAERVLARWHAGLDRDDFEVYSFPDPDERTVRLVEVSDEFPRSEQVWAATFGPSQEFPFRSSVVLVDHADWQRVLSGDLPLPEGWELRARRKVWPNGGA